MDLNVTNIIVDVATASWIMGQVVDLGLRCHLQMGFPYKVPGHRVCCIRMESDPDADFEMTNLCAVASERASYYVAQPYVYPKEGVRS